MHPLLFLIKGLQTKVISIIIPTLNEEAGIQQTISAIPKEKIRKLGHEIEIIVIDGNSTDLTRDVAIQMGAKVLDEKRRGYGRAYKTGLAAAKGDIIVTLDGDNTYPAERIPEYIQKLNDEDIDFITINRFSETEKGAISYMHRIGNKGLSLSMCFLYSVTVKDSQSGMWIMRKSFLDRINLQSDDMPMSEEIKIIAFKFFRALELDGKYYRRIGTPKLETIRHGWMNLKYLFYYRKLIEFSIKSPVSSIYQKEIHYEN
jgi:glycosyltransferase involved in cell wall biosynthesis